MRVLVVGACFVLLPDWFGHAAPLAVKLVVAGIMLGSALWLLAVQAANLIRRGVA